jgi:hypothetical protein
MNGELNEQALNRHYEDFSKEANRLMSDLKGSKENEKESAKQLALVQSIMTNIFRLRSMKKKANEKL